MVGGWSSSLSPFTISWWSSLFFLLLIDFIIWSISYFLMMVDHETDMRLWSCETDIYWSRWDGRLWDRYLREEISWSSTTISSHLNSQNQKTTWKGDDGGKWDNEIWSTNEIQILTPYLLQDDKMISWCETDKMVDDEMVEKKKVFKFLYWSIISSHQPFTIISLFILIQWRISTVNSSNWMRWWMMRW